MGGSEKMIIIGIGIITLLVLGNMIFYELRVQKPKVERDLLKDYSRLLLKRKYK